MLGAVLRVWGGGGKGAVLRVFGSGVIREPNWASGGGKGGFRHFGGLKAPRFRHWGRTGLLGCGEVVEGGTLEG